MIDNKEIVRETYNLIAKKYFEEYFEDYSNWVKVGIFADEGISGTSLNKRDEFNRMCALAKAGKIDMILTKEVSRFSRNIKDFLNILYDLTAHNVSVYFLAEGHNVHTRAVLRETEILGVSNKRFSGIDIATVLIHGYTNDPILKFFL